MNSRTPSMFSNRTIGFYLGLAAGVMAIVSLVAYAMYAVAAGSYNVWVIAPLVLVVLAQAATIPLDNDWLIAVMIAWCAFVMECMYTFVGHFMNLNMFGDQSLFGPVMTVTVLTAATVLMLMVSSFMRKRK